MSFLLTDVGGTYFAQVKYSEALTGQVSCRVVNLSARRTVFYCTSLFYRYTGSWTTRDHSYTSYTGSRSKQLVRDYAVYRGADGL